MPARALLDAVSSWAGQSTETVSSSLESVYTTSFMLSGHLPHSDSAWRKYGLNEATPDYCAGVVMPVRTWIAAIARSYAAGPLRGLSVVALNGIDTKRAAFRTSSWQNSSSL